MTATYSRMTFLRLDGLARARTTCPIVFMIVYNCAIFVWMSINITRTLFYIMCGGAADRGRRLSFLA